MQPCRASSPTADAASCSPSSFPALRAPDSDRRSLRKARIRAAFVDEITEQSVDRPKIRAANEGHCLALLGDESSPNQPIQMMGEGGSRDVEALPQPPDRQTRVPRAHQHPTNLEPSRITERVELLRSIFEFH